MKPFPSNHGPVLPSGTVTLLFTDIGGSTQLWESRREDLERALARHDELLRRAIRNAGGFTFQTVGDAFCAAFSSAREAVSTAVETQRAPAAESWPPAFEIRVRMALHTGECLERDMDYFGRS
jgi:class 3 adenylate cyclase